MTTSRVSSNYCISSGDVYSNSPFFGQETIGSPVVPWTARTQKCMDEKDNSIARLRKQLEIEELEKLEAQEELRTTKDSMHATECTLRDTRRELDTLRTLREEIVAEQLAQEEAHGEKETSKAVFEKLRTKELREAQKYIDTLQQDIQTVQDEKEQYAGKVHGLHSALKRTESKNGELLEALGFVNEENEALKEDNSKLTDSLEELRKDYQLVSEMKELRPRRISSQLYGSPESVTWSPGSYSGEVLSEAVTDLKLKEVEVERDEFQVCLKGKEKECEDLQSKYEQLQSQVIALLTDIEQLNAAAIASNDAHTELSAQKNELVKTISITKVELDITENKLSEQHLKAKQLQVDLTEAKYTISQTQSEIDQLNSIVTGLRITETEKQTLEELHVSTCKDLEQKVTELHYLEEVLSSERENKLHIEEKHASVVTQLTSESGILKNRLSNVENEVQEKKNELQDLQSKLKRDQHDRLHADELHSVKVVQMNLQFDQLRKKISDVEKTTEERQNKINEIQMLLEQEQNEKHESEEKYKITLTQINTEMEDYKSKLAELENNLQLSRKQLEEMQKSHDEEKVQHCKLIETHTSSQQNLQFHITQLTVDLSKTEKSLEASNHELRELQNKHHGSQVEMFQVQERLKKIISEMSLEMELLKTISTTLEKDVEAKQCELKQLQAKIEYEQEQKLQAEKGYSDSLNVIKEITAEYEKHTEAISKCTQDLTQRESELKEMQTVLCNEQTQRQTMQEETTKAFSDLTAEKEQLTSRTLQLEENIEEKKSQIQSIETRVEQLAEETANLKSKLVESEKFCDLMKTQIGFMQLANVEVEHAKTQLTAELELRHKEYESKRQELETFQMEFDLERGQRNEEQLAHASLCNDIRMEKDSLAGQLLEVEKNYNSVKDQVKSFQLSTSMEKAKVDQDKVAMDARISECLSQNSYLVSQKENLKKSLDIAESKVNDLNTTMQEERKVQKEQELIQNDTIDQLKKDYQESVTKSDLLKKHLDEMSSEYEHMKAEFQDQLNQKYMLTTQLSEARNSVINFESQIQSLQSNLVEKQDQFSQMKEAYEVATSQMHETVDKLAESLVELEKVKVELGQSQNDVTEKESHVKDLTEILNTKGVDIDALNAKLQETLAGNKEFENMRIQLLSEVTMYKQNIETQKNQLLDIESNLELTKSEKEALQKKADSLECQKSDELQEIREKLEAALDTAKQQEANTQLSMDALSVEFENAQKISFILQTEKEEIQQQISGLNMDLEHIKQDKINVTQDLREQLEVSERKVGALTAELAELHSQAKSFKEEKSKQLATLTEHIHTLMERIAQLDKQYHCLEQQLQETNNISERLKLTTEKIDKLQHEKRDSETKKQQIQDLLLEASRQSAKKDDELIMVHKELELYQFDRETLRKESEAKEASLQEISKQLEDLKLELSVAKDDQVIMNELTEKNCVLRAVLQTANEREVTLQEELKAGDTVKAQLVRRMTELKFDLDKVTTELQEAKLKVGYYEFERSKSLRDLSDANLRISEETRKLQESERQLEEYKKILKEATEKVSNITKDKEQLESRYKQIKTDSEFLQETMSGLTRQQETLTESNHSLMSQLNLLEDKYSMRVNMNDAVEGGEKELLETKEKLIREIEQLTNQKKALEESLCMRETEYLSLEREKMQEVMEEALSETRKAVKFEYQGKLERLKARMTEAYLKEMGEMEEKLKRLQEICEEQLRQISFNKEHVDGLNRKVQEASSLFHTAAEERDKLTTKLQSMASSQRSLECRLQVSMQEQIEAEDEKNADKENIFQRKHVRSGDQLSTDQSTVSSKSSNNNVTSATGFAFSCADEEGEVFDNTYLGNLQAGSWENKKKNTADWWRLGELQRRNTLCLPHLKSSYPAETQFHPTCSISEEQLKGVSSDEDILKTRMTLPANVSLHRPKRKEKMSYVKPGPPTPGKYGSGPLNSTNTSDMSGPSTPKGSRAPLLEHNASNTSSKKGLSTPGRLKNFLRRNQRYKVQDVITKGKK